MARLEQRRRGRRAPPLDARSREARAPAHPGGDCARCAPARPQQRLAAFEALPRDKQDEVIARHAAAACARRSSPWRRPICAAAWNWPPARQQVVARDLAEGKLLRAVYSNRQLEEVLADFWFNHFNVFLDKGADHYLVTEYERDAIRPHVLGKFRDLLEATAKSPAMLFYLDNWQSVGADRRGAPEPSQPRARPERELRPRAAGAAHAGRGRRLYAEGRHRSGALLHRLDHPPAAARRRLPSSIRACTTTARRPCWA